VKRLALISCAALLACTPAQQPLDSVEIDAAEWVDLSKRDKPEAIATTPWFDVTVIVKRFEDIASFFTEIGGFETVAKNDADWILRAPGSDSGYIHLVINSGAKGPNRPPTSQAWDKGCYWSIMMRAKNIPSIIDDAKALGWTPLTDMAFLEFGPSKLNIIVLTHESGVRVQLYERLTTDLPEGFTPFERISRPFNIMQMVEDRDASYDFFQQGLGLETFYYGKPYLSEEEEVMPLGIPPELTTEKPYKTAIMTPFKGAEWGRMEMIDIDGMDGKNYADQCTIDYTGIYGVGFTVPDITAVKTTLKERDISIFEDNETSVWVKTPDGANIEFWQR